MFSCGMSGHPACTESWWFDMLAQVPFWRAWIVRESRTNGGRCSVLLFSWAPPQGSYSNLNEILRLLIGIETGFLWDFVGLLAELNAHSAPPKNNGGIRGRGRFLFMSSLFKTSS